MATIYDVAKRAGVSHTAVSAVLNGKAERVSPATQQRILEAVAELGYKPSRVARQLATGRSGAVAVCFESPFWQVFLSPMNSLMVAGIGESMSADGYSVLISPSVPNVSFEQTMANLPSQGIDGVIVIGSVGLQGAVHAVDHCEIPVVCMDCYPGFRRASSVDIDNAGLMRKGVEHLVREGHRRVLFLGPPPTVQCHADRARAFCEVMQEYGISDSECAVRMVSEDLLGSVMLEVLREAHRPTAIVCGMGSYGTKAWAAIKALGLRVPEEISLLCFDHAPEGAAECESVNIIQPVPYDMGAAAAEVMKDVLSGAASPPVVRRLWAELILRPSPVPG